MASTLDLAAVIAQVESNTTAKRLRFESELYVQWGTLTPARSAILATIARIHDCSHATARSIACTSWGLYQILGENLYDHCCGYGFTVFDFVDDPDAQRNCLDNFLRTRGIAFSLDEVQNDRTKREQFIQTYNGPGDISGYWADMQAAIAALEGKNLGQQSAAGQ